MLDSLNINLINQKYKISMKTPFIVHYKSIAYPKSIVVLPLK